MTIYLDTHVLVWLAEGSAEKLGKAARRAVDTGDLVVSPACLLELELLHEIGRLKVTGRKLIAMLEDEISLRVCELPFRDVVRHAVQEGWTRDPFDRLIVGNARAANSPLATKDERIRTHYPRAIW